MAPPVAAVAVACAVLADGTVRCWGEGYSGELGNGSHDASEVPVPVSGIASGAVAVSAGEGWDGFHLGCVSPQQDEG